MTDARGQMAEDRGQMAEDRGQMADGRGQMTEVFECGIKELRADRVSSKENRVSIRS